MPWLGNSSRHDATVSTRTRDTLTGNPSREIPRPHPTRPAQSEEAINNASEATSSSQISPSALIPSPSPPPFMPADSPPPSSALQRAPSESEGSSSSDDSSDSSDDSDAPANVNRESTIGQPAPPSAFRPPYNLQSGRPRTAPVMGSPMTMPNVAPTMWQPFSALPAFAVIGQQMRASAINQPSTVQSVPQLPKRRMPNEAYSSRLTKGRVAPGTSTRRPPHCKTCGTPTCISLNTKRRLRCPLQRPTGDQ